MSFRDWFWRKITIIGLRQTNKVQSHYAPSDDDYVRPIPMDRRYPGLAGARMYLSENTPKSELPDMITVVGTRLIMWLKEVFSLTHGYPEIWDGKPIPFPADLASVGTPPVMPEDLRGDLTKMLEGFAHRGPFATYLTPAGDEYHFDFKGLEGLKPREPFVTAGGVARFKPRDDGTMQLLAIEFGGKTLTSADGKAWELGQKRVVCALNSYSTFVDHLTHVHLCGANTWAICTFLAFSARHPMRILLQPFTVETIKVNNDNIDGLIKSELSNVPCYTGYPLATLNAVMKGAFEDFDLRWFDAELRQKDLKQTDPKRFPTLQSVVDMWRIYRKFTKAWVDAYLTEIDAETMIWCKELDARVPNGVKGLLGITDLEKELTPDHVAHLATIGMFICSVWHFTVADMMRNYELFPDKVPTAVNADGLPTVGIMLEKRNSIAIAAVFRYRLVDDSAYMPEPKMRALWSAFQSDLKAYEANIPAELKLYSVIPSLVPSSVHA
jgi:hypothetical protein